VADLSSIHVSVLGNFLEGLMWPICHPSMCRYLGDFLEANAADCDSLHIGSRMCMVSFVPSLLPLIFHLPQTVSSAWSIIPPSLKRLVCFILFLPLPLLLTFPDLSAMLDPSSLTHSRRLVCLSYFCLLLVCSPFPDLSAVLGSIKSPLTQTACLLHPFCPPPCLLTFPRL